MSKWISETQAWIGDTYTPRHSLQMNSGNIWRRNISSTRTDISVIREEFELKQNQAHETYIKIPGKGYLFTLYAFRLTVSSE
jgi:hypothetical protein